MSEKCRSGRKPNKTVRRAAGLVSTMLLATGCVSVNGSEALPPMPECRDGLRNAQEFIVDEPTLHDLLANKPAAWQEMTERVEAKLRDSNMSPHSKFSVETTVLYPGQTNPNIVSVDLQQKETAAYRQALSLGHLAAANLHYYPGNAGAAAGGDGGHKATIRLEEYCQVTWPTPTQPPQSV